MDLPADYATKLRASGWRLLEQESVSNSYMLAVRRMLERLEAKVRIFGQILGSQEFGETLRRRRHQVNVIGRGLVAREMFLVEAA